MNLAHLLEGIDHEVRGSYDMEINNIVYKLDDVNDGSLYIDALSNEDIDDVIRKGCNVIVTDDTDISYADITIVYVKDIMDAMAKMSLKIYNYPNSKLKFVSVLGSKDMSLYIDLFKRNDIKFAYLNNNKLYFKDNIIDSSNFQSIDFIRYLNNMVKEKIDYVLIDANKLNMNIIKNILIDYGIFVDTNLLNYEIFNQVNYGIYNMDSEDFYEVISSGDSSINTYGKEDKADLSFKILDNNTISLKGIINKDIKLDNYEGNYYNYIAMLYLANILNLEK